MSRRPRKQDLRPSQDMCAVGALDLRVQIIGLIEREGGAEKRKEREKKKWKKRMQAVKLR